MLKSGRKKTHTFNTVKSHVSWESLNNTTEIWAHENCKGTSFKTEHLEKQPDVPSTKKDEGEEASNMVGNTPQATKVFTHRKGARKRYAYTSSWKDKDLMKCVICDEEKRKKGRPLPLTNISLTEKAEETLKEYSELYIKNNNAKYIDGANQFF